MNALQRHNQSIIARALRATMPIASLDVGDDRLITIRTKKWCDYWGSRAFAQPYLQQLRRCWHEYIEGGCNPVARVSFVHAYFALLHRSLLGCLAGDISRCCLAKVAAFGTFPICSEHHAPTAGLFNIRNPAYLLSALSRPLTYDNPKYLPVVCTYGESSNAARLFVHYRRIGISSGCAAELFVYPPANARERSASYRLIAELFAALTPKTDPWVQERSRLLFDGAFGELVSSLRGKRLRVLDIACGSAKMSLSLCRSAFDAYGTSFDLSLLDVVRTPRSIAPALYRNPHAFANVHFHHDCLYEWLDAPPPRRQHFDMILMLRVCDLFSRIQLEGLSYRDASGLMTAQRGRIAVDVRTTQPARLLEANDAERLHTGLRHSEFRGGALFHQFSLSDFFRAIKIVLDGTGAASEDMLYTPVRRWDESALVLPSGKSLIAQLLAMGDRLLIEDVQLTPHRLREHLRRFGLSEYRVIDLTKRRRRGAASISMIVNRSTDVYFTIADEK